VLISGDVQTWIGAIATIAVYSYLFAENPFWRLIEHLFIGMAAAYTVAYQFNNHIKPYVLTNIGENGEYTLIIPIILGLLVYARYSKSIGWLARYPLSFWVGYGAGMVLSTVVAVLLTQVTATFLPFYGNGSLLADFSNIVFWLAAVTTLMYFFFTVRRENVLVKYGAGMGRWAIMITLGAAFGNTCLFRYNLFLGRMRFILVNWLELVQ